MGEGFVHDRIPKDLMEVLLSLASDWGDVINDPYKALQMTPLKGAMTNQVYHVSWPAKQENRFRKVLVRVYGEGVEVFFDRDDEIRTFECMSRHGQGPLLLGRFPDGRVEEFIHARTLSAADLRDPKISALIATKLREFHNLDMPGPKIVVLWNRIRNWLNKAKSICSSEELKEFGLDTLEEDISLLEKELRKEDEDIGFCHNDLQYGNIMIDEETGQITIIDYEYASFNPVAYDLANHFCEMAADYHSDTPHILDYSKYPGVEERRRFISIYVNSGGGTKEANDAQVEELLRDSHEYTLANHLFWGLWGIISSYVNKIDFNYMEYARQRFHQYYKARKLKKLGGSSSISPLLED